MQKALVTHTKRIMMSFQKDDYQYKYHKGKTVYEMNYEMIVMRNCSVIEAFWFHCL